MRACLKGVLYSTSLLSDWCLFDALAEYLQFGLKCVSKDVSYSTELNENENGAPCSSHLAFHSFSGCVWMVPSLYFVKILWLYQYFLVLSLSLLFIIIILLLLEPNSSITTTTTLALSGTRFRSPSQEKKSQTTCYKPTFKKKTASLSLASRSIVS